MPNEPSLAKQSRLVAAAVAVFVHLMVSLPLHPAVLEPRLYLLLSELDKVSDLDAAVSTEVAAEMKLLL